MNKEQVLAQLDIPAFFGQELERLSSPKENGEATALCPFHADKNPSLSVNFKTGEHFCHACHAKGDIFSFMQERYSLDFPQAVERLASFAGIGPEDAPAKPARKQLPKCPVNKRNLKENLAVHYCYHDVDHSELFYILRYEKPGYQKDILQGRMVDGKMTLGLNGMRPTIYRLPEVSAASFVVVVEGENKAEALASLGICATCNPGGAGKWKAEYAAHFQGKGIVILPDNDEPGRKHAEQVAASLHGVAAYVKICDLPGLPLAGDIIDWLEVPGNDKERLQALMNDAPEWKPQDAEPEEPESPLSVEWQQYTGLQYITAVPDPLDYFLDGVFLRGDLGGIIGAPGCGKGHLAIRLCAYVGAGIPVFGEWHPVKPETTLYISAEDRLQTIQYRFRDACFDLPEDLQRMAAKNFVGIPVHGRVEICRGERSASISTTKNYSSLCTLIEEIKPGLVILDTLSRFFGLEENDNAGMTAACGLLEEAAFKYGCNILLIHHTNKASGDLIDNDAALANALSQTALRGASSLAGAFRLLINCTSLGSKLAGEYLGDEARRENPGRYMCVRLGKNNYGPLGEKMFFRRGQHGFLTRVEPVSQEDSIKSDAEKLANEVKRRAEAGETPLSESKGASEFLGYGIGKGKKVTEKAIQLGLLEAVNRERGKGKVLSSASSETGQNFGMFNYDD